MNATAIRHQLAVKALADRTARYANDYNLTGADLAATLGGDTSGAYYVAKAFAEVYARAARVLRDQADVIDAAWMTGYIQSTASQASMYLGDVAEYTEKGFPRASIARVRGYADAYRSLLSYLIDMNARFI